MSNELGIRSFLPRFNQIKTALTESGKQLLEKTVDAGKALAGAKAIHELVQKTSDVVDNVMATADWGGTAAEHGAKFFRQQSVQSIAEKVVSKAEKVGIAATAISTALHSDAKSVDGKALEGALAVAGTKLMVNGLGAVRGGNPVMLADMALNYVGDKVLGEDLNKQAGGYISGHVVATPAKLAIAYYDAIAHGDFTAMDKFRADALAGEHGAIYKKAMEAGEALSGTLSNGIEATVNFFRGR